MKGWINGIGWVTPTGCGMGRQGGDPLQPGPLEIPTRKQIFAEPDKRFGRLDDFSRLGLAAIAFCLRDAEAESWQEKRRYGIVAASRYGCLVTDLEYHQTMLPEGGKFASPNLFAYTVPNSFLGEAALRFGLQGSSHLLNLVDPSRLGVLRFALQELDWENHEAMLAGICDLSRPQSLPGEEAETPGALFLLLGREPQAGAVPYGELELCGEELRFAGKPVADLPGLVEACLNRE